MRSTTNASAASRARRETAGNAAPARKSPAAGAGAENHNKVCRFWGGAFCLPCFRRRKRPLSGRENSLLFECNGPLAHCLNCCETGGGGAAACLERRARSADCTLAAEAAAVAAAAAAQDQDPDQIKSAAATAAATTSAVVMFKTSTIAAATAAAQDQDQEDHIAPASSVSTPASTITTAVCCRYITHY